MKLTKQISIRLTENEYKRADKYKELRNKYSTERVTYRHIFLEKLNDDMAKSNIGIEIKRDELLKEYDELKKEKTSIIETMEEIEIKLTKIDTALNNSTLYDLANYRHNTNIVKAVNSVKSYCIHNVTLKPEYIPPAIFMELETTFKIKEKDLLKNIVFTEFSNWEEEIKANTSEAKKDDKIKKLGVKVMAKFRRKNQPIKDLSEYLETNKDEITKTLPNGYTFNDIKEYLLNLENTK